MSWFNGVNGEDIENFEETKCHICKEPLGYYCLTDRYEGITSLCTPCYKKEIKNKKPEEYE